MQNTDNIINELLGSDVDEENFERRMDMLGNEANFSFDLIFNDFIKSQITEYHTKNTITSPLNNYLKTVKDKMDFLKTCAPVQPEVFEDAKKAYKELLLSIINTIEETFEIEIDQIISDTVEDLDYNNLEDCVFAFYNFIVIERYVNLKNFLTNYIFDNRTMILKNYPVLDKSKSKKNLSIANIKKTFKSFEDALIIFNLEEIVKEILTYEISIKDFQDYLEERAGLYYNAIFFKLSDPEDTSILTNCMKFFVENKFALEQLVCDVKYGLTVKLPKK